MPTQCTAYSMHCLLNALPIKLQKSPITSQGIFFLSARRAEFKNSHYPRAKPVEKTNFGVFLQTRETH